MTDISEHTALPTVTDIFRHYEDSRENAHRPHLGASQIGHHCDRFLWYQFHWCDHEEPEGRVLRLFDHGDSEEDRLIRDLRAIGCQVYAVDPDTGRQVSYQAFGGHFRCSLDGVLKGIREAPHKWHLFEAKTANGKKFGELKRKGLKDWNPQYHAQVIVGMELAGLSRTLHITVCKDNDDMHGERIKESTTEARRLLNRAERIIFGEEPLERVSDKPDWYQCKWCAMQDVCHYGRVAEVNCRTCVHSTPERDGTWSCDHHGVTLSTEEQRQGCESHLMRPQLVPYAEAVDAGEEWVEYTVGEDTFRNHVSGSGGGEKCYTSQEMRAYDGRLPMPEDAERIRVTFGGGIESGGDIE